MLSYINTLKKRQICNDLPENMLTESVLSFPRGFFVVVVFFFADRVHFGRLRTTPGRLLNVLCALNLRPVSAVWNISHNI